MKKNIDIEKLVQWAVRDELPKGRAVSADIGSIVIRPPQRAGSMSAALDRPRSDDGFGFVPGAPHEDALVVSEAIRALATEARFDNLDDAMALFGDLAAIAGDAAASIMAASFDPRSLVICKGAQSMRPQWEFPQPIPRQMWTPFRDSAGALRERPLVHGDDADGDAIAQTPNRGYRPPKAIYDWNVNARSPLDWWRPSLITIGHARAEYVAWYGALVSLARDLAGRLVEYEAIPPALMPAPWITGQTPSSRVLDDGMPPGILKVKLTLAPKRRAPGKPIESKIEAQMREGRAAWASDKRKRKAADLAESAIAATLAPFRGYL
jgi:hypothetical protein